MSRGLFQNLGAVFVFDKEKYKIEFFRYYMERLIDGPEYASVADLFIDFWKSTDQGQWVQSQNLGTDRFSISLEGKASGYGQCNDQAMEDLTIKLIFNRDSDAAYYRLAFI